MRGLLLSVLICFLIAGSAIGAERSSSFGTVANLTVSPASIEYPEYTKPSVQKNYTLTLQNTGQDMLTFSAITAIEDSVKGGATPPGWLAITGMPAQIVPGGTANMTVQLNKGGVVNVGPRRLFGRVVFNYDPPSSELTLPIEFIVADTIVFITLDTITTQCGLPLVVGTNGNMGHNFLGGGNLGFPAPSPECDTGLNSRGDASIYLGDASPVIVRKLSDNQYTASWAVYDDGFETPNGFKPLAGFAEPGYFSSSRFQGYKSGTFCTVDSLVKVERTWYAPAGPSMADSCNFIIMRTLYFPYSIGQSVTGLAIGDIFDFDVPSDSGDFYNVGGIDATRRMVWVRGFNTADAVVDCYDNSLRYAGITVLDVKLDGCVDVGPLYGGYNAANDSFVYPAGGFVPAQVWNKMQTSGFSNETRITDLHSVLTYVNSQGGGWTLPANDTLAIWTAIAVVRPTGGNGLDSLRDAINRAKWTYWKYLDYCVGCGATGSPGNVNGSASETPDLSDLSLMIAYLTLNPRPTLPRLGEANMNCLPEPCYPPDLTDLSLLIAVLTVSPPPPLPSSCP